MVRRQEHGIVRALAPWAAVGSALVAVACGSTPPPSDRPPPAAVQRPAVVEAPSSAAAASPAVSAPAAAAPTTPSLPDGTLPTLAGAAPDAGIAVPAAGAVDWLPPAARLQADARTSAPWIATFAGRATARWSLQAALEVQGVVIDGSLEILDEGVTPPRARTVGRWGAFRAPGGAVSLRAAEGASARVILFAATRDGMPVGALLRDPEAGGAPRKLPAAASKARPMPLEVVDLHDRAALRWGAGKLEARIAWDAKDAAAALDVIVFAPDAAVGEHTHPGAWECLLPLRVAGEVIVDGTPRRVVPGVPTCIPPDVKHAWKPAGTEPLVAVQVYAPAGAEQRFRDLAAKEPPR